MIDRYNYEASFIYLVIFSLVLNTVYADYGWPVGTYGLPEPASGCPVFGDVSWKRGYTYHNTEDESPANKRSQNYHFAGNFSQHGVQQRFCIKDQTKGVQDFWPEGKYCIYKKGICPGGLEEGFVTWDDEHHSLDQPNKKIGSVPDGNYEKKTYHIKLLLQHQGKCKQTN